MQHNAADRQVASDVGRYGESGRANSGKPAGSLGQASEDLARSLFTSANHAMAGLVRELQRRTHKLQKRDMIGPPDIVDVRDLHPVKAEQPQVAFTDPEQGASQKPDLWVVGGASTVMDAGCEKVRSAPTPKDGCPKAETAPPLPPAPSVTVSVANRCSKSGEQCRTSGRFSRVWLGAWNTCLDIGAIVRLHPVSTLTAPLAVLILLAGLGVWSVLAGSMSYVQQRKDDARSQAVDAATGFQIQLEQTYTPGVTFSLLVRQHPEWEYWLANFNSTAEELMSRTPAGALWNMQLQPFGQLMSIYPFRPSDAALVSPPRDQLTEPLRRESVLAAISTREPQVAGPLRLGQGFLGALIRYPIFVPNVSAQETFGFRYRENASALAYSELPSSVRECGICYNTTSREKWWGLMTLVINYEAVAVGDDAYLARLRKQGFYYTLLRPINDTHEEVIAKVGPAALHGKDSVTVEVKALNSVWLLRVVPAGGFAPAWKVPLVVAVLLMALVVSVLLLVAIASLKRAKLLLEETMAANRNLAEAMKRLEEEKERMDVLLIRQYDLLRCLDLNRASKKAGGRADTEGEEGSSACASKRRMMAQIEDARRCLNAARASSEDPIQLFDVLGTGAFGKVQRGMWRGTVVAVKTMILPANMTGQEKREKMAVMEAAISSSLVHPNIVTTYTYFIRPYHEPQHDGVQQMLSTLSNQHSYDSATRAFGTEPPCSVEGSISTGTEHTVHSYEVRLVLEFCDKGSLKDALDQHAFMQDGSFNLEALLETAADVAKAMVHMHAANVLHSDLKARNIMLKSSGTEGRGVTAKVADFGLSTRMEHQETHLSSCFQGTLTHMAPEVMLEGRISKAADVYSFGILMWELFCAGDPFAGVPRAHIGHAITKEGRRPKFPPFAPRDYVALAARCWDPDAAQRPSFEQVLAELVRMREEMGGETRPLNIVKPPALQRNPSKRHCSRNGSIAASFTQVSGSGGGGGGCGTDGASLQRTGQGDGSGVGRGSTASRPFRGLLARSISANGASMAMNPLLLYRAGVVVGDSYSDGCGSSSSDTAPGLQRLVLGYGNGSGITLHAGSGGMKLLQRSVSASDRASRAQRERLKALLLERQMRKLGLHMSSRSNLRPATSLPVLDEGDGEPKSSGRLPRHEPLDESS